MGRKPLSLPTIIAVIVVVVGLLCFAGYRQLSPPSYATTKETGVPDWVKNWKPNQKTASAPMTSSGPAPSGPKQAGSEQPEGKH